MLSDLAVIGGVIAALTAAYYIYDVVWGETRPHPATWSVWALIGLLGALTTQAGGAGIASVVTWMFFGLSFSIFSLSLVPKYRKPESELYDWWLLVFALIGIAAWQIFGLPVWAAATVAWVADLLVFLPTYREAKRHPRDEAPWWIWGADAFASTLAVVAIKNFSYASLAYLLYLAIAQGLLATTLFQRRNVARKEVRG